MRKYTPSVKSNNALKDEICSELKSIIYRIEKGKIDKRLDKDSVDDIKTSLKVSIEEVSDVTITGQEDFSMLSEKIKTSLADLKKSLDQDLFTHVEDSADNLRYYLDSFVSVANEEIDTIDEESVKEKKLSWSKKRLYAKLDELGAIKAAFTEQEKRLEKEINGFERDISELEGKMVAEDNERLINDLYRKISSQKSKLDMLIVRQSNYSACFGILDIIYANANEILTAGEFSADETAKAKALLNIEKLREVASEPDKAIGILKAMEKDIKDISAKTQRTDEKVFALNNGNATVSENAMAMKAELMRKMREKEQSKEDLNGLSTGNQVKEKNTEEV